jgi:hemoglobin-like flavoprotein
MATAYVEPSARARKITSTVMQHVHADRQTAIAAAIGVHESTVSRLLSDHLDKLAQVLAHAGLKVVPEAYRCVDPEVARAIEIIHDKAMQRVGSPVSLMWEDE